MEILIMISSYLVGFSSGIAAGVLWYRHQRRKDWDKECGVTRREEAEKMLTDIARIYGQDKYKGAFWDRWKSRR